MLSKQPQAHAMKCASEVPQIQLHEVLRHSAGGGGSSRITEDTRMENLSVGDDAPQVPVVEMQTAERIVEPQAPPVNIPQTRVPEVVRYVPRAMEEVVPQVLKIETQLAEGITEATQVPEHSVSEAPPVSVPEVLWRVPNVETQEVSRSERAIAERTAEMPQLQVVSNDTHKVQVFLPNPNALGSRPQRSQSTLRQQRRASWSPMPEQRRIKTA